jgi:heme exporter protein C
MTRSPRIASCACGHYQDHHEPDRLLPIRRGFWRLPGACCHGLRRRPRCCWLLACICRPCAPDDYQQGATVKIMFIHVPNAWLSMFVWGIMSMAALGTLVWRHPLADVAAKAAAPLGAAFTFLALVTGSLWGRPMWGTYWEWDARLTSVLILFLMYLGIMALWRAVEDPSRAARAAAILTLVGAINLPIIKFSVDWWNTLHQGASVMRAGGPTMDRAILIPLLVMALGVHATIPDAASCRDAQRDFAPTGAHACR